MTGSPVHDRADTTSFLVAGAVVSCLSGNIKEDRKVTLRSSLHYSIVFYSTSAASVKAVLSLSKLSGRVLISLVYPP